MAAATEREPGPAAAPTGFADPVHESQRVFRAVLAVIARPGTRNRIASTAVSPTPLDPIMAAVALTLVDQETTLWLSPTLAVPAVRDYLVFHTSTRIVTSAEAARFVLCASPAEIPPLASLAQGTPEYPDRAAMVVVATTGKPGAGDIAMRLTGPGIGRKTLLALPGFDAALWRRLQANHATYPSGVDTIICYDRNVLALPRSTHIEPDTEAV